MKLIILNFHYYWLRSKIIQSADVWYVSKCCIIPTLPVKAYQIGPGRIMVWRYPALNTKCRNFLNNIQL